MWGNGAGLADCSQVAEWPRGWEEEEGGGDLSFAHGAAGSTPTPIPIVVL